MSRNVQLVLLCEDRQHETFLRRFLEKAGWSTRRMRIEMAPPGQGSAEQFVRERFPIELSSYRAKRYQVGQALFVMFDGDDHGVAKRLAELDEACRSRDVGPRRRDDRVAVFVPTWRIETWLAYLDGETVDEGRDNYQRLRRPRDCREHVNILYQMCQEGNLRQPAPPSLEAGCEEYRNQIGG